MFRLFFVLYFVKLPAGNRFLNVLYRVSDGSSPLTPFCFFLFVSFFVRVGDVNLLESTMMEKIHIHK